MTDMTDNPKKHAISDCRSFEGCADCVIPYEKLPKCKSSGLETILDFATSEWHKLKNATYREDLRNELRAMIQAYSAQEVKNERDRLKDASLDAYAQGQADTMGWDEFMEKKLRQQLWDECEGEFTSEGYGWFIGFDALKDIIRPEKDHTENAKKS